MARLKGLGGLISIGTGSTAQVAELREWELERTAEVVDASVMGTTWKDSESTLLAWSGKAKCFYDPSDADGQVVLLVGATVALNFFPGGIAVNAMNRKYSGSAIVASAPITSTANGLVEVEFSFTGKGALTEAAAP